MFSPLFSQSVYLNAIHLMTGHILCKGRRTITNCLRAVGLRTERRYSKYHDVIRKTKWSTLEAAGILLLTILKKCNFS